VIKESMLVTIVKCVNPVDAQ